MNKKSILIFGESFIDQTIYGKVLHLASEAPIPIIVEKNIINDIGGSGNVAKNLIALDPEIDVHLVSYINILNYKKINNKINYILSENISEYNQNKKIRYTDEESKYYLLRVDTGKKLNTLGVTLNYYKVIKQIEKLNIKPSAFIFSDYNEGFFDQPTACQQLITFAKDNNILTILDSRRENLKGFFGVDYYCPNRQELEKTEDFINKTQKMYRDGCGNVDVKAFLNCKGIIAKKDVDGLDFYIDNDRLSFPATNKNIVDSCGAGDTLISSVVLGMLKNLKIYDTLKISNHIAGDICMVKGAVAPTKTFQEYYDELIG